MRRYLLIVVAVLLVVPAAILLIFSGDVPAPDDAVLRPVVREKLADADNAWTQFAAMGRSMKFEPDERLLLGRAADGDAQAVKKAAPLVARSGEALSLLRVFSRRRGFQVPDFRDPTAIDLNTPIPQFWPLVSAAKLASLRADARGGSEGLEDAFAILDAGALLTAGNQPIIVHLVGLLLRDLGARRLTGLVRRGGLGRARLVAAARRAGAYGESATGLQDALRYEYSGITRTIEQATEKGKIEGLPGSVSVVARLGYFYKPNATRAIFAGHFRPLIEAAGKPCLRADPPAPPDGRPFPLAPNVVGHILYQIAIPSYGKLCVRRCEADFRVAAAATDAALAAFKLDHGRGPKALAELVPAYLERVPVDPYTGEPLGYSGGAVRTSGKDASGVALVH